jgi:hypothetical protein
VGEARTEAEGLDVTRQLRLVWRSAALERGSGLSSRARLAASVYCEFANGEGVLDPAPSMETIAAGMAVALSTAHKGRQELEAAGWLSISRRPGRPSRIVLASAHQPLRHTEGSNEPTPPKTPPPTPPKTPPPDGAEPDNQLNQRARGGELALAARPQELVRRYVDRLRAEGIPVPRKQVGHVAGMVGELARDGVPAETIERALELMHERRLHPSTLASLVIEAAAGPGSREHPADQLYDQLRHKLGEGEP